MKTLRLTATLADIFLALPAAAQTLPGGVLPGPLFPQVGSGSLYPSNGSLFPNSSMPRQHGNFGGGHRHDHGFGSGGFIIYDEEPYVVHDVEVIHDEAPEPSPAPPPPRQAWVLGKSYTALPGGCLKMLTPGGSFFDCSGEWYLQVATGYQAVRMP